eukprot:GHUV01033540.1.p1 GENE.GHUV01033540.1~~GHUV01033540.1.p1  ORF type:complete len:123 (-),score=29.31 GHUV01033540.1:114-482(-)
MSAALLVALVEVVGCCVVPSMLHLGWRRRGLALRLVLLAADVILGRQQFVQVQAPRPTFHVCLLLGCAAAATRVLFDQMLLSELLHHHLYALLLSSALLLSPTAKATVQDTAELMCKHWYLS